MAKKQSSLSDITKKRKSKPQTAKWGVIDNKKIDKDSFVDKGTNKSTLKAKTILTITIPILILILLIGSIFVYEKVYANKIYPGSYVAGTNLSGLTVDEANALLNEKVKDYKKGKIIINSNGTKWNPSLSELGAKADIENSIKQAYDVGRDPSFLISLKEQLSGLFKSNNLPFVFKTDEKNLSLYLSRIGQNVDKPASNATLVFDGAELKNVPAKKGLVIDKEKLEKQIKDSMKFLETKNIYVTLKTDEPNITEKNTVEARNKAVAIISSPINFTYGDQSYTADSSQIASWIVFSPAQKDQSSSQLGMPNKKIWYLDTTLDETKIRGYLETIAEELNVEPKDTKIIITDGQKLVLDQGYEGKTLDMDNAVAQIKDNLNNKKDRQIALVVKTIPAGEVEANNYGIVPITKEKYIDVSLSGQVLTCFDGGKSQFVTLVSSGIAKYPSPTGTFHIYLKKVSTEMKGYYGPGNPDNYDLLNVPYAMFFSGDYSIHGTYWHNNFGNPMSHGCINTPTPAASWIYDWAPVGTMVYIH